MLLIAVLAGGIVVGAAVGAALTRRQLTEEIVRQEARALAFAEAADRNYDLAQLAGLWVLRLREIVDGQTVLVRRTLGLPQKRPVPTGSRS